MIDQMGIYTRFFLDDHSHRDPQPDWLVPDWLAVMQGPKSYRVNAKKLLIAKPLRLGLLA